MGPPRSWKVCGSQGIFRARGMSATGRRPRTESSRRSGDVEADRGIAVRPGGADRKFGGLAVQVACHEALARQVYPMHLRLARPRGWSLPYIRQMARPRDLPARSAPFREVAPAVDCVQGLAVSRGGIWLGTAGRIGASPTWLRARVQPQRPDFQHPFGDADVDPAPRTVFRPSPGRVPPRLCPPPRYWRRRLNDDRIPGPREKPWSATAIRDHRTRGTGILDKELDVGPEPAARREGPGDGQARLAADAAGGVDHAGVPDLRIIEDDLSQSMKTRQGEIDATPAVRGITRSRSREKRHRTHLLTGKLVRAT